MKQYVGILFLTTAMQLFCGENDPLVIKRDSVAQLRRCCLGGGYRFEYRSEEDYNKNSCTRPLKKIIDYTFCENRDSCCIKNRVDPKECYSWCDGYGLFCGFFGPLSKILSIGIFTDQNDMSRGFCSRCACDFGWFPSCSQQFNCGNTLYAPEGVNCCAQISIEASSLSTICGCALISCLLCRRILKEKGQNDRSDY